MSRRRLEIIAKLMVEINIRLFPLVILLYALAVIAFTIYLNERISTIFVFFCTEMFLNWYCVYRISCKSSTVKGSGKPVELKSVDKPAEESMAYKYWYCEKCQVYVYKPVQHCSYCNKCYHFKDDHSFLLGVCVLRQNMGNFILLCFYASLASMYSMYVMGWRIYQYLDQVMNTNTDLFNLFENFCFPFALIRLLSKDSAITFLFLVFNIQIVIHCLCMGLAIWKLYACLNGKQYYAHLTGKQNLKDIFGSYGLMNLSFPYNGLVGKRNIDDYRYQLKEV